MLASLLISLYSFLFCMHMYNPEEILGNLIISSHFLPFLGTLPVGIGRFTECPFELLGKIELI